MLDKALWISLTLIVLALAMNVIRLARGPDIPDRLLALDTMYVNSIALIVMLGLSRRLASALSYLETAAHRIGAGDFTPIERRTMPTRELSELQDAFEVMLRRFNEARHALDTQMTEERRMREELQLLQRQVIRQERLAAVGQLVSGVAHEINNPLQAILGFAELLQMQPDLPESAKGDLQLIQKESTRACNIIRNLAMFARQQPTAATPLRLGDVIASVVELRRRRLEAEEIELVVDDSSTAHVSAVQSELQQVLLNFVVNAEQKKQVRNHPQHHRHGRKRPARLLRRRRARLPTHPQHRTHRVALNPRDRSFNPSSRAVASSSGKGTGALNARMRAAS